MKRGRLLWILPALAAGVLPGTANRRASLANPPSTIRASQSATPSLHPDYAGATIPPNIAPLNFRVAEPGERCRVRVEGGVRSLQVESRSMKAIFPERPWRALLAAARGGEIRIEVSVRQAEGGWRDYAPVSIRVASDEIDRYLAYRRIKPLYNLWRDVGVYQRDLASFREWPIIRGAAFADGCVNCHSFRAGHTDAMAAGIRGAVHGNATVVLYKGRLEKQDARWGYPSWHPDGRRVAYSLNKVRQFFHAARQEPRDVVDLDSDVVVQDLAADRATAAPAFADPDRLETYPCWASDGRSLYFCSAVIPWTRRDRMPPQGYDQLRYDLSRARFDPKSGTWGPRETLLSASATGKSILLPRPSPDGRWVLFCMCEYGCFPIYQSSSDLYLLDLKTGKYRALDALNSPRSESWHSWSSNSRWIVYSSKRDDGVFTRTYIAYVAPDGTAAKPFILPVKDPDFYDSDLRTFSVPELTVEPVPVSARAMARAARRPAMVPIAMPEVSMTRKPAKPTAGDADHPWQSGRPR